MFLWALTALPVCRVKGQGRDGQGQKVFLIDGSNDPVITRVKKTATFGIEHLAGTGPTRGGRYPLQHFAGMDFFVRFALRRIGFRRNGLRVHSTG